MVGQSTLEISKIFSKVLLDVGAFSRILLRNCKQLQLTYLESYNVVLMYYTEKYYLKNVA